MKNLISLSLLLLSFSIVTSAQEANSKVNKSISISIDDKTSTVDIEEEVNGEKTTIHLEGEEAEAWIESNQYGYTYSYTKGCSPKISEEDADAVVKELRQVGIELGEELDDVAKYIDDIDVQQLVDEIQKSVDEIQKEIEIKIRTSSDDDSAVI